MFFSWGKIQVQIRPFPQTVLFCSARCGRQSASGFVQTIDINEIMINTIVDAVDEEFPKWAVVVLSILSLISWNQDYLLIDNWDKSKFSFVRLSHICNSIHLVYYPTLLVKMWKHKKTLCETYTFEWFFCHHRRQSICLYKWSSKKFPLKTFKLLHFIPVLSKRAVDHSLFIIVLFLWSYTLNQYSGYT